MRHKGTPLMVLGLLFIVAAALLLFRNRGIDSNARDAIQSVSADLLQAIEENTKPVVVSEDDHQLSTDSPPISTVETSDSIATVNNTDYIGLLDIPALSLSLPVQAECSTVALENSPCRYSGSLSSNDLVIAGHNYNAHFGQLHSLSIGDSLYINSADGTLHAYTVQDIEILSPYDVEVMCAGDWPLTLFTCTYGGQSRVAIRCSITD